LGRDRIQNAVSLDSVRINAAWAVGPAIAGLIIAVAGVSVCFLVNAAYEFQVSLPLPARVSLHGTAPTYGFLTSAMGAGAIDGGLIVAVLGRAGLLPFTLAAAGFGAAILIAALVPSLALDEAKEHERRG
jgi:hypothetical protein